MDDHTRDEAGFVSDAEKDEDNDIGYLASLSNDRVEVWRNANGCIRLKFKRPKNTRRFTPEDWERLEMGLPPRPGLVVVDVHDLLAEKIPPRGAILTPVILEQSLSMIHAWRGAGKTHVALGIAWAVASGGTFLRWRAQEPRKVLYIDGEMPGRALQERLAAIAGGAEGDNCADAQRGYLRICTPDKQDGAMPDLATVDGQGMVDEQLHDDTALIVIDNLSCLARRGGPENEAESWMSVAEWALAHRARGRSILFIHHSGKNGQQRGTSKREDLLDTVLSLRQTADYDPTQGAVFEVHFEKARGLHGKDVEPFEARLMTDGEGRQRWEVKDVQQTTFERVIELTGLGLNQSEIARELEISRSTVCRTVRQAEEKGRLAKDASKS